MNIILRMFCLLLLFPSCNNHAQSTFQKRIFGGADYEGYLFQKKYKKTTDSSIEYQKWPGVEIKSNEELESLLKFDPNCEAIKFTYWNHDTLNNFALTEKIGEFKNLKYLDIYSNRITKYPKELEKLTSLNELILQVGNKNQIEIDFSGYKSLKHLTIHYAYNIEVFPSSIYNCTGLESLKLIGFESKETTLNGLEKLTNLKELFIWDSKLILPNNANYSFDKLETLVVDRMRTKLPNYFYSSLTIKRLAISSLIGKVDTINLNFISKMKNLENLNLHFHKSFTGSLSLPKLEHLDISDYNGEEFTFDFDGLPSLESLVIWGCDNLRELNSISNSKLRSISIVSNKRLEEIHFNDDKLRKIEEVILSSNISLKNRPKFVNSVNVKEN